ncbi:MAG: DUF1501 domain-containing protein, partial [Planctomycetaceae bacterium]|nr:DUF1501 domain-containing protein [Planctomycetaceae bacterium]
MFAVTTGQTQIAREIATNVPGLQIGDLLPMTTQQADRIAIIRSMSHTSTSHARSFHPPRIELAVAECKTYSDRLALEIGQATFVPFYRLLDSIAGLRFTAGNNITGFVQNFNNQFPTGGIQINVKLIAGQSAGFGEESSRLLPRIKRDESILSKRGDTQGLKRLVSFINGNRSRFSAVINPQLAVPLDR